MKFWKKLQNPFLLVGQGFVIGGLLFFASLHQAVEAHSGPATGPLKLEAATSQR